MCVYVCYRAWWRAHDGEAFWRQSKLDPASFASASRSGLTLRLLPFRSRLLLRRSNLLAMFFSVDLLAKGRPFHIWAKAGHGLKLSARHAVHNFLLRSSHLGSAARAQRRASTARSP